jgi:hypothetical protein
VFVARSAEDGGDARRRAEQITRRLRSGEPAERIREEIGDAVVAPLPDVPLPPAKLREYLGPSVLDRVRSMEIGEVSDPIETPQGFHVAVVVDHVPTRAPPFEDVRDQVRAEVKRRAGDRALRERLDDLRSQADVQVRKLEP